MIDSARKCWVLLPPGLRWGAFGLFLLMNLQAVAQLGMVGSVLPFLQMIAAPERMAESPAWSASREFLGPMDDRTWLLLLGMLVVAAVLFSNLIGAAYTILVARFSAKLDGYLSTLLLRSYLFRPYCYFLNRNSSEFFRNIFSEIYYVSGGFLQTGMGAIARLLTIVALSLLLVKVNPWVAIGAGAFFGSCYTVIYFTLRRHLADAADKRADSDNLRYKAVTEAFGTIKELKVLRREPHFIQAFEDPSRDFFRHQQKAQLYSELPRNLVETVAFGGMVVVALLLLQQHEGVGGALPVLGLFAVAGYRLLPAIQGFYKSWSQLRYYRSSVDTVHRECAPLLQAQAEPLPQPRDGGGATSSVGNRLPLRHAIQLHQINFNYPACEIHAVRNVSLTLPARARIGFCGKSGSGKTTLADIILGLLQAQSGTLTVDGLTVNESNCADWQRNCGYVPQQIFLTDDSIRRNIAFGIPVHEIQDDLIRSAARLANLDAFVETELPDGYDTLVGENGIRLSGGQRQRIGIARALYHDPEVIVLDEATSSLDPETEAAIIDAVQTLSGRKTILMIAHRFSTIRQSDMIVFMENGTVKATGTFDQLVDRNENFKRMARI